MLMKSKRIVVVCTLRYGLGDLKYIAKLHPFKNTLRSTVRTPSVVFSTHIIDAKKTKQRAVVSPFAHRLRTSFFLLLWKLRPVYYSFAYKRVKMENDLLELISKDKMSPMQKSCRNKFARKIPMYKLLREPSHLDEIEWPLHRKMAIWRENGTIICMDSSYERTLSEGKYVSFCFYYDNDNMSCVIYGETDVAIAETVTFFCSLKQTGGTITRLDPYAIALDGLDKFDFAALEPEQLARILDANPTQNFRFRAGKWNAEKSLILANRPYPLKLTLSTRDNIAFTDGGTAFVEALEKRQSSFGSLNLDFYPEQMAFNCDSLARLLKLEIFEALTVSTVDEECALLPFSVKVDALDYRIFAEQFEQEEFDSLEIVTKILLSKFFWTMHTTGMGL